MTVPQFWNDPRLIETLPSQYPLPLALQVRCPVSSTATNGRNHRLFHRHVQPPSLPLKIIAGADSFGCSLKDTLVSHLRSLNIEVEDLGTSSYYSIAAEVGRLVSAASTAPSSPTPEIRGLVACGTGVGVSIFANKFPGVFAATCLSTADAANSRSINNSNVLAVSGMATSPDSAIEILDTWLKTPFKSPCPASNSAPWGEEIESFLDNSLREMPVIGAKLSDTKQQEEGSINTSACALCCLVKNRKLDPIEIIPGGAMKIVRESPTSAIVSFKAGSVEPAHHHTFGHDLVVLKGSKRWEGKWDIFFDEEMEVAKSEIEKEAEDGFELVK
uniref:DNA-damage-repair/toleration protein DRT102 n=1 Tax=Populus alba TaxID=43335 RepID=A0A4U5QPN8_POPAL|nr:DNA-damage-repair/toleration protein DRT102 [Populus alba]